jgi:hypothetical protein
MIFKDLINEANIDAVSNILKNNYYDDSIDINKYIQILERLKYKNPKENPDCFNFIISLKSIKKQNGEIYVDVSAFNPDENNQHYAIELRPWCEWLAMKVDEVSLATFKCDEIVAHCLYEMTCISFDEEEIKNFAKELFNMCEQIKSKDT